MSSPAAWPVGTDADHLGAQRRHRAARRAARPGWIHHRRSGRRAGTRCRRAPQPRRQVRSLVLFALVHSGSIQPTCGRRERRPPGHTEVPAELVAVVPRMCNEPSAGRNRCSRACRCLGQRVPPASRKGWPNSGPAPPKPPVTAQCPGHSGILSRRSTAGRRGAIRVAMPLGARGTGPCGRHLVRVRVGSCGHPDPRPRRRRPRRRENRRSADAGSGPRRADPRRPRPGRRTRSRNCPLPRPPRPGPPGARRPRSLRRPTRWPARRRPGRPAAPR